MPVSGVHRGVFSCAISLRHKELQLWDLLVTSSLVKCLLLFIFFPLRVSFKFLVLRVLSQCPTSVTAGEQQQAVFHFLLL